jgi:transcriptional regulator with XRE-family HTH domain
MRDYGKELKEIRISQGLTQNDLFHLTGTARQYIGKVENMKYGCSVKLLNDLLKPLGHELRIMPIKEGDCV